MYIDKADKLKAKTVRNATKTLIGACECLLAVLESQHHIDAEVQERIAQWMREYRRALRGTLSHVYDEGFDAGIIMAEEYQSYASVRKIFAEQ